jgi:hypothetical protein
MARIQKIACLLLPILIAGASACTRGNQNRELKLNENETRLVEETMQMIRIRLEMTRDPALAADMRTGATDLYTDEELEFLLDRLATDSARGELVMSALNDSLQNLRTELFPPTQP